MFLRNLAIKRKEQTAQMLENGKLLKLNQVTEIGAFMVRTKLASEFEFTAPILQGRTAGTENKFKNFCLFTTL